MRFRERRSILGSVEADGVLPRICVPYVPSLSTTDTVMPHFSIPELFILMLVSVVFSLVPIVVTVWALLTLRSMKQTLTEILAELRRGNAAAGSR